MNPTTSSAERAYGAMNSISIPHDWSTEQALAVWEFLQGLTDAVWYRYELPLVELLKEERATGVDQLDMFDPNEELF